MLMYHCSLNNIKLAYLTLHFPMLPKDPSVSLTNCYMLPLMPTI